MERQSRRLTRRDALTRRRLLRWLAAAPAGLALGARLGSLAASPALAADKTEKAGKKEGQPSGERPNLLLITIDSLRADALGAYGYADARTPNIDQIGRAHV